MAIGNPPQFIGIDVGGTKTAGGWVDDAGRVSHTIVDNTASHLSEPYAAQISRIARLLMDRTGRRPDAIGIGFPGYVDSSTGTSRTALNLEVIDSFIPILEPVVAELGIHCTIENDVRAAALGAYLEMRRQDDTVSSLAYISIGTGLAAGLVVDGRILKGRHNLAGEIGHVPLRGSDDRCHCGLVGCGEAFASGAGIASAFARSEAGTSAQNLFEAARTGDDRAAGIVNRIAGALAEVTTWILAVTDADVVALGGGVAGVGAPLLDAVCAELRARLDGSLLPSFAHATERLRIFPPSKGVAILGAAAIAARDLGIEISPRPRTERADGNPPE